MFLLDEQEYVARSGLSMISQVSGRESRVNRLTGRAPRVQ